MLSQNIREETILKTDRWALSERAEDLSPQRQKCDPSNFSTKIHLRACNSVLKNDGKIQGIL